MKETTSLVFTGDIGFDRYMYGQWDDKELLSKEILDFLHSADHVITNVEGPIAEIPQNTVQSGVKQLLHTIDPAAVKVLKICVRISGISATITLWMPDRTGWP